VKSVAVVGLGFVGGTLTTVLRERGVVVNTYDPAKPCTTATMSHLIEECEQRPDFSGVYFVCVPTPMRKDGSANLDYVDSVLAHLTGYHGERIAVIKSTVPPGSTERWNKIFSTSELRVIFCPEFLTEANALEDMRNQNRIILGGPRPWINRVKQVFQSAFPKVPSTVAEMVKYFTNVHLATRVVLSCELWQLCEKLDRAGLNIDYDKVVEYAQRDPRLGSSHMSVPGNDGIAGARGHCFPKDLAALISVARAADISPTVMEAVQQKNLEVVPTEARDWEQMIGRAVSQ
jgi:UDPglucose 6-dehydrogenase